MTRGIKSPTTLEQISIRLPLDLINQLNEFKEKNEIDRSAIIIKAVRYWLSVGGNVSTDNEYITQIKEMSLKIENLTKTIESLSAKCDELSDFRELLSDQQNTIHALVKVLPNCKE